ncbi:hypothetical protein ADK54_05625 [Streptomyces sp. WM6378]|nr:hypothetical protein ADK54_05625 [Streptomyces sp. WM6378]
MDLVLAELGPRLRALRRAEKLTLQHVTLLTGIGVSTLSRLEAGKRSPSLDLLVPLAAAYRTPLEDLLGVAQHAGEPPVVQSPRRRSGIAAQRLSHHVGGIQVYRLILPPHQSPAPRRHDGYGWLCVLVGEVQLVLSGRDLTLGAGDAAEFDTHELHWFGAAGETPAEVLFLAAGPGDRLRLRVRMTGEPDD